MYKLFAFGFLLAAQVSSPQCGSSPSSPTTGAGETIAATASNVLAVAVNGGPLNSYPNAPFVSVTICVPGGSSCQTIGSILLDTGSTGLRVLSSALTLSLPQQTNAGGAPIVECFPFVDSTTWGPVQSADIKLGGEVASNTPVQVIGTDKFPTIPSGCSSQAPPEETLNDLGANGILGIGLMKQDCGSDCTFSGPANFGFYYSCPASGCAVTTEAIASQLQNPVSLFSVDNNGSALQLPAVAIGGAPSVTGLLVFGIGTQSDNSLGAAKVFRTDQFLNFSTSFNGQSDSGSFIDSGSNGIFFLSSAATGLSLCKSNGFWSGFYCPPALRILSASQSGLNGTTNTVSFNAGNLDSINITFSAIAETTGPEPPGAGFDWGLPFFYGRTVFTAIEGQSTPGGIGPYWAY